MKAQLIVQSELAYIKVDGQIIDTTEPTDGHLFETSTVVLGRNATLDCIFEYLKRSLYKVKAR